MADSFRLDRTISLLIRRLVPVSQLPQDRIPILMYHSIREMPKEKVHPYFSVTTTPESFSRQMAWLKKEGYTALRLRDIRLFSDSSERKQSMKPVIITFDDGFDDFYTNAFPILRDFDFTATVFLPTEFIGNARPGLRDLFHLSWQQISELARNGIDFGSHTVTHPKLVDLSRDEIAFQLLESKKQIESHLRIPCDCFAYPFAFPEGNSSFVKLLQEILSTSGYLTGVTTKVGLSAHDDLPFFLKRLPINEFDEDLLFEAKLTGAYNWVYIFQYLKKKIFPR